MGISRLLDPEDLVDVDVPDERSVMTYVSEFYNVLRDRRPFDPKRDIPPPLLPTPNASPPRPPKPPKPHELAAASVVHRVEERDAIAITEPEVEGGVEKWAADVAALLGELPDLKTRVTKKSEALRAERAGRVEEMVNEFGVAEGVMSLKAAVMRDERAKERVAELLRSLEVGTGLDEEVAAVGMRIETLRNDGSALMVSSAALAGRLSDLDTAKEELSKFEAELSRALSESTRSSATTLADLNAELKSGIGWCQQALAVEALIRSAEKSASDLDVTAKSMMKHRKPFTLELSKLRTRMDAWKSQTESTIPPQLAALSTSLVSLPSSTQAARVAFYESRLFDLQASYAVLASSHPLHASSDLASALDNVLTELEASLSLLEARLESETALPTTFPHGLDPTCDEDALARCEREAVMIEGAGGGEGWRNVMRRAKAEQAIAGLMALGPAEDVRSWVVERATALLAMVERVQVGVRRKWERLERIGVVMRE
ncbi:hypothetical protein HK101_005984, partial [Irineochytrium annulatum]